MKKIFLYATLLLLATHCKNRENKDTSEGTTPPIDTTQVTSSTADLGYKERLARLPVENESMHAALELFKTTYTSRDSAENDFAFKTFMDFQRPFLDKLNDKLTSSADYETINTLVSDDSTTYSKAGKAYEKSLANTGLILIFEEGQAYLELNTGMVKEYFYASLSPAGKTFLSLSAKEITEHSVSDGGLTISFQGVADRLGSWNNFIATYPNSVFHDAALEHKNAYWRWFLNGLDNTPVFDDSKKIYAEPLEAYRYYIKKYSTAPDGLILQEYLALLSQSKFQKTNTVEAFLLKHG